MGQTAKTPRENRTITVDFSVEVEDGVLPTPDWLLNLQIPTSGAIGTPLSCRTTQSA